MEQDDQQPFKEAQQQPELKRYFETYDRAYWFYRNHRRELIEGGAVIEIAGRLFVRPRPFLRVLFAVGQRALEQRHSRDGVTPTA